MAPVRIETADLSSVLPPDGLTLVSACSAESFVLGRSVAVAGDALGAMTFAGVFVPGLNRETYLHGAKSSVLTFFLTPELRAAKDRVAFLPLCYADILAYLEKARPNAALVMLSPPDADGFCSFGTEVDFIADLWNDIPIRIAHINQAMPRTRGRRGPHIDELTAFMEAEQPLLESPEHPVDEVSAAIANNAAWFIGDGATLQTGIGKTPSSVLRALRGRRNLRIHSGLIGDAVVDLMEAGALAPGGASATVGVAIGTKRLYAAVGGEAFEFQPVSVTHDPRRIGDIPNFVAINSAIEVDLFGQAFAEMSPHGLMSGPGGASDYARGARLGAGLRMIALPALDAKRNASRIVAPGAGTGPVALGRMDIDIIVTEFGAADLRGKGYDARAAALIAIADPAHRETLTAQWKEYSRRL